MFWKINIFPIFLIWVAWTFFERGREGSRHSVIWSVVHSSVRPFLPFRLSAPQKGIQDFHSCFSFGFVACFFFSLLGFWSSSSASAAAFRTLFLRPSLTRISRFLWRKSFSRTPKQERQKKNIKIINTDKKKKQEWTVEWQHSIALIVKVVYVCTDCLWLAIHMCIWQANGLECQRS